MKRTFFYLRRVIILFAALPILLSGCNGNSSVPTNAVNQPSATLTATKTHLQQEPTSTLTPTPANTTLEVQGASEVSITHPNMEIISPENITSLSHIETWGQGKIYDVAVSPNKQTIALITKSGISLYDSGDLNLIIFIELEKLYYSRDMFLSLSFIPDGKYLAFSGNRQVSLLNLSTYEIDRFFRSGIPSLEISNIQISHDNKHIILRTQGPYWLQCDAYSYNFALYDISQEHVQLIYNQNECGPNESISRFTETGKAYFIYFNALHSWPDARDIVDLSSNLVTESVFLDFDSSNNYYDISSDEKTIAFLEKKDDGYITKFVNQETNEVIQIVEEKIIFTGVSQNGEPIWEEKHQKYIDPEDQVCEIVTIYRDSYKEIITHENQSTFIIYLDHTPQALEIWDTSECKRVKEVSSISIDKVVFSPNSQLLATQNGYDIDVWDIKTGQILFTASGTKFRIPADVFTFSNDSLHLITGTYGEGDSFHPEPYQKYSIAIWDIQTGNPIHVFESGHNYLRELVTGNNPALVAITDLSSINFWNINSGEQLSTIPGGLFEFTRDGNYAWLVNGKKITLYDVFTGEKIKEFVTPYRYIEDFTLFEDDSLIALKILSNDKKIRSIIVINTETGFELYKTELDRHTWELNSNGRIFTTHGSSGFIDLWDFHSDLPFRRIYGFHIFEHARDPEIYRFKPINIIDFLGFSANNDFIISYQSPSRFDYPNILRFWDIQTGNLIGETKPQFDISGYRENTIAMSPNGQLIIFAGTDGIMRLWGIPSE